jgi:type II secretory pathway component PulK
MTAPRRGFALLAVLWLVVALGALAAGATLHARADAAVTGDRVLAMRGRWAAEGCLVVALARLDGALRARRAFAPPALDTLTFANGARCEAQAIDPGTRLRRDSVGAGIIGRLDSLLAARGDTSAPARDTLLTEYGDGRVNVNAAPAVVLAALPGFGPEALRFMREARAWGRPLTDLGALAWQLSPSARNALLEHYGELAGLTTFATTSLVITARGWVDGNRPSATIEVLVVNAGTRAAVVRRRMW